MRYAEYEVNYHANIQCPYGLGGSKELFLKEKFAKESSEIPPLGVIIQIQSLRVP